MLEDRPSFAAPVDPPENIAPTRDSATVMLVRDGDAGLAVEPLGRGGGIRATLTRHDF